MQKKFGRDDIPNTSSWECAANSDNISKTSFKKLIRQMLALFQQRYGIFMACRMPDWMDLWGDVSFKLVKHKYWDLVVSTAWPYGVHRTAYRLKKTGMAACWISDWRDLWTDNHMFPGLPGFRVVERWLEKRWSMVADALTTVSEPLADTLRQKYGNKVHVIYNGFDQEDYENLPAERIFPDDGLFRIVYTGSIYVGQRDPTPLFEAVRNLHTLGMIYPNQLRIIFCGMNANVSDLARKHKVEEFVEYAGFLPRQQALRMQRDADVLLFLEFESAEVRGILTGKLFEYLFAGPMIWGVGVDEDSSSGLLLDKTGRGKCFGTNVEKIAEAIRMVKSIHFNSIKFASKVECQVIGEFSREKQSKRMLSLVK